MPLSSDAQERKDTPIYSGVLLYFPDALAEVARVSKVGNDQHNPGEPLHWAKEKSMDEGDALIRHQLEAGTFDTDGTRHSAKVAWRALAQLQRELDAEAADDPDDDFLNPPAGQRFMTSSRAHPRTMTRLELAEAFHAAGVSRPIAAADATIETWKNELEEQRQDWTWLP